MALKVGQEGSLAIRQSDRNVPAVWRRGHPISNMGGSTTLHDLRPRGVWKPSEATQQNMEAYQ